MCACACAHSDPLVLLENSPRGWLNLSTEVSYFVPTLFLFVDVLGNWFTFASICILKDHTGEDEVFLKRAFLFPWVLLMSRKNQSMLILVHQFLFIGSEGCGLVCEWLHPFIFISSSVGKSCSSKRPVWATGETLLWCLVVQQVGNACLTWTLTQLPRVPEEIMWGSYPASSSCVKSCLLHGKTAKNPELSDVRKEVTPGRLTPGTCVLCCAVCSCQHGSPWGLIPGEGGGTLGIWTANPPTVGPVFAATSQCSPASLRRDGFRSRELWQKRGSKRFPSWFPSRVSSCWAPFGEQKATGLSRRRGRLWTGVQWSRQKTKTILAPGFLQKTQTYMPESPSDKKQPSGSLR